MDKRNKPLSRVGTEIQEEKIQKGHQWCNIQQEQVPAPALGPM